MPYSRSSYLEDEVLEDLPPFQMAISVIPALTVHILFLFKSSTFGRLVLEHPPLKWQFHRFLPYCEGSYLADQVLADLSSLPNGNFTDSCFECSYFILTQSLNIWQTSSWHIPPSNGNFTDSCSDCSYFLTYSKSSTFGRPGLGRSNHLSNGNFTNSCSTLRAHIWQTMWWQICPPSYGNLTHSCSYCSYFFPTLGVQHLVGQVLADLTPLKYQFHRFFPYSESSYLADQVLEELPPFQKAIPQIHALL